MIRRTASDMRRVVERQSKTLIEKWRYPPVPPPPSRIKKIKQRIWNSLKVKACYYCHAPFRLFDDATLDHVKPLSLGGKSTKDNMVLACKTCNGEKGNKYPWAGPKQKS